jgi:hypothetical protein
MARAASEPVIKESFLQDTRKKPAISMETRKDFMQCPKNKFLLFQNG